MRCLVVEEKEILKVVAVFYWWRFSDQSPFEKGAGRSDLTLTSSVDLLQVSDDILAVEEMLTLRGREPRKKVGTSSPAQLHHLVPRNAERSDDREHCLGIFIDIRNSWSRGHRPRESGSFLSSVYLIILYTIRYYVTDHLPDANSHLSIFQKFISSVVAFVCANTINSTPLTASA